GAREEGLDEGVHPPLPAQAPHDAAQVANRQHPGVEQVGPVVLDEGLDLAPQVAVVSSISGEFLVSW
ncbi:MAG: hypothetical protein NT169_16800, partial [Chloroflexi bacterium]|nr:hypothetical protein [Chloroflexota bacterium]